MALLPINVHTGWEDTTPIRQTVKTPRRPTRPARPLLSLSSLYPSPSAFPSSVPSFLPSVPRSQPASSGRCEVGGQQRLATLWISGDSAFPPPPPAGPDYPAPWCILALCWHGDTVQILIILKQQVLVGEDGEKGEPSCPAGGNAGWCSHRGNSVEAPQRVRNRATPQFCDSTPGYLPEGDRPLSARALCSPTFTAASSTRGRPSSVGRVDGGILRSCNKGRAHLEVSVPSERSRRKKEAA